MSTNLQTDPRHTGEAEADRARQSAFDAGYTDYTSGFMTHAPDYPAGPLAAAYEAGAAAAVFDVVEKRHREAAHLVLVPNPVGRKYAGRHRAVTA